MLKIRTEDELSLLSILGIQRKRVCIKFKTKVSKMSQWIKTLASKAGDLSLIPVIHMVDRENGP